MANIVKRISDRYTITSASGNTVVDFGSNISNNAQITVNGRLDVRSGNLGIINGNLKLNEGSVILNTGLAPNASPTSNASIIVNRGTLNNASIMWNESVLNWQISKDGSTYSNVATQASGSFLTALADDVAPVLGGDLQLNGYIINGYLPTTGGTMTGELILNGEPLQPMGAATKSYVDASTAGLNVHIPVQAATTSGFSNIIASFGNIVPGSNYTGGTYLNVPLNGGTGAKAVADITVTANVVVYANLVSGGTGYTVSDLLSANIADIGGTGDGLFSVQVATVTSASYLNGTTDANGGLGVGATLTGPTEILIVDGRVMALNDRVLVKNETNQIRNGVYILTTPGFPALTSWVLTRAYDDDNSTINQVAPGDFIFIASGTTQAGSGWTEFAQGTSADPIAAANLTPGIGYIIHFVGTTDFTATGGFGNAASNVPGQLFTVTGPGTGTGAALIVGVTPGAIKIGTDNITYVQFSEAGAYFGTPNQILKTGSTFSLDPALVIPGSLTASPSNLNVTLSPTGTGTVIINPSSTGTIDNISIGATTANVGRFTNVEIINLLGSSSGGTGNGFTKFTGPTTSEKTFTLPDASGNIALLSIIQTFTKTQIGAVTALAVVTDAVAVDLALTNNFSLTLQATTGQILSNPTNAVAGTSGQIAITQNATPSALAFGSYWISNDGTTPLVSTTPAAVNLLTYYVVDATHIWFGLSDNGVA